MKVRLGDYVNIKTGKLDANAAVEDGAYPFFTCAVEPLKIDTFSYDCECVLVAGNGDLNVKYYSGKFDAYQRTYIIESKNKDELTVPYLYCFLDKYVETLREQEIGGVIKYIKLGNLTEAQIELLPIKEQDNVVEHLNKVNKLIEKRKEQLEKLDLFVKSKFIEMFSEGKFEEVPIAELVDTKIESANVRFSFGDLIRYVDISSIDNKLNIMKGFTEYAFNDAPSRAQQCLMQGDIVISTVRPNLRNIAMNDYQYSNMVASSGFCVLRAKRCNAKFLFYAVLLDNFSRKMSEVTTGANYPAIKDFDVLSYKIPSPPVELQNVFTEFAEKIESIKFTTKQSLYRLETLKKSLMQKYFG